jgi:hypothetical protein
VANEYRTNDADLPAGEKYRQRDPPRAREWAGRIGPAAVTLANRIFGSVPVDEQGLDAALAVLRLSRRYSAERVEAACRLALAGRRAGPAVCASAADPGHGARQSRRAQATKG